MSSARVQAILDRVEKIASVVQDGATESEQLGHLTPAVFAAVEDAGLFRIMVAEEFGGDGLTIPESIEIYERVASLDTSTGWTATILSGWPLLVRFLSPEVRDTFFADSPGLIAATLNPVAVRVEAVDDGFVFSGRATYLSGSAHARWIMASGIVMKDGNPEITEAGIHIRSGLFSIDQARDLDTWHVTGMRATSSTDYEFDGVRVPAEWTFAPLQSHNPDGTDVFQWIPLWAQLGSGLAASAVGAAANMLDRFAELAGAKVPAGGFVRLAERAPAQMAFGEAQGLYQAARAVLMDTVNAVWARGVAHEPFDNETLGRQRVGVVTAVRLAARAIDLLHDAAGMNAIAQDSVLDRCWRDVHTITQHTMLAQPRYEIAGGVLLGLEPSVPII